MAGRIRRSDLFGTVTNVEQGRVLTAEEEYGSIFGGVLEDEEDYVDDIDLDDEQASLFGGVLEDEEDYVDDIDLDDEQASLFGGVLEDEEDYVDDIDLNDEQEDLFGTIFDTIDDEEAYVDDVNLDDEEDDLEDFGADDDDPAGAALDAMDASLNKDLYGAYYGRTTGALRVPGASDEAVQSLANALNIGAVMPGFLQSIGEEPGWIEQGFELANDFLSANETREIAKYLMLEPGFANWNQMGLQQQADMVRSAITKSAELGIEMTADEPVKEAYRQIQDDPSLLSVLATEAAAGGNTLWNWVAGDAPRMVATMFTELGAPLTDDQMINSTAIRYLVLGNMYPELFRWLAQSVTKQGQAAIRSMSKVLQDLGTIAGPSNRKPPSGPIVQPPPMMLPSGSGFPDPAQILAAGTGLIVAGAMLGIFE